MEFAAINKVTFNSSLVAATRSRQSSRCRCPAFNSSLVAAVYIINESILTLEQTSNSSLIAASPRFSNWVSGARG